MFNIIKQIWEFIVNILIPLFSNKSINKISKKIEKEKVHSHIITKVSSRFPVKSNWKKYQTYNPWTDDIVYKAAVCSNTKINPSIFTIHYAAIEPLSALTNYFHKYIAKEKRSANSTWGMHNITGEIHRYLKPDQKIWTNGKGAWTDHKGIWRPYTNGFALSVEIAQMGNKKYGEACYESLSKIVHWMIRTYPNFKVWRIMGHEHLVGAAIRKADPSKWFDWNNLFVNHIGIRKDFFDEYLSFLDATAYNTQGNRIKSNQKGERIKIAVNKQTIELKDKPSSYAF